MNRDAAWQLLTEYTKSDSLLKHAMAVEAAVRGYARRFARTRRPGAWSACSTTSTTSDGRRPRIIRFAAAKSCDERGYPEWVMRAISVARRLQRRAA